MSKFSVNRNPTFTASVPLPVVGGKPVNTIFTFKFMDRIALSEFQGRRLEFAKKFAEYVGGEEANATEIAKRAIEFEFGQMKEIIAGWEIEEEFNDENLRILVESGSEITAAIVNGYLDSYAKAREGN